MTFSSPIKTIAVFLVTVVLVSCTSNDRSFSPSIIEIVDGRSVISKEEMIRYAEECRIDKNSLYNWENRWVLYLDENRLDEVKSDLKIVLRVGNKGLCKTVLSLWPRENCNKKVRRSGLILL